MSGTPKIMPEQFNKVKQEAVGRFVDALFKTETKIRAMGEVLKKENEDGKSEGN